MSMAGDLIVKFDNSDAVDAYKKATINYETARLQLNETEKDYWDLKEDLDECIEDIEFYKEKWKDYEDSTDPDDVALYNNYFSKWEAAKTEKESLEKQIPSADYIKIQQLNFELTKMSLDEAEDVYNNLPQDIYAQHDGVIETIGVTDYGTAAKGTVAVSILTSESNTVEFNIGRYDIGDIQVGQKGHCHHRRRGISRYGHPHRLGCQGRLGPCRSHPGQSGGCSARHLGRAGY